MSIKLSRANETGEENNAGWKKFTLMQYNISANFRFYRSGRFCNTRNTETICVEEGTGKRFDRLPL